jgi:hypothetical protein
MISAATVRVPMCLTGGRLRPSQLRPPFETAPARHDHDLRLTNYMLASGFSQGSTDRKGFPFPWHQDDRSDVNYSFLQCPCTVVPYGMDLSPRYTNQRSTIRINRTSGTNPAQFSQQCFKSLRIPWAHFSTRPCALFLALRNSCRPTKTRIIFQASTSQLVTPLAIGTVGGQDTSLLGPYEKGCVTSLGR